MSGTSSGDAYLTAVRDTVTGVLMLYLQSANVKEGRQKEYQAWVKKNEGTIEKHAPKGWIYRGTFGTVFGFGRYDTTTMWEISKYGDLDASREHRDETFE